MVQTSWMATAARSLQNVALAELAEQLQGDNAAKTKVEMENILLEGQTTLAKSKGWGQGRRLVKPEASASKPEAEATKAPLLKDDALEDLK